jgi:serine phosphatase RsbU (regulator of sigma subunit)
MVIWRPKEKVGGDLYLLHESEEGVLLGLADCTGHGVAGAMMTMTVHAILTQLIRESGPCHPARLLQALNSQIRESLNRDDDTRMDNGLEMGLIFIDRRAQTLRFAGARLGLYLIRDRTVTRHHGDRQSLGYLRGQRDFVFEEIELPVTPGCTYLMLSDGILDQSGGERGLPFGSRRLSALLTTTDPLPLDKQCERIQSALSQYQGEYPQRDDITLIAFRDPKKQE